MKQLFQSIKTGQTRVLEVPLPALKPGHVLVRNATSLVSAGTERAIVDFSRANLLEKARARPDLVRQVLTKAQREGLVSTFQATRSRLDQQVTLGYSCAGSVLDIADDVSGFEIGQRVACAGAGYACHAEVVCVPRNLVVTVPAGVEAQQAAFCTLGSIALHGLRLAQVQLGETVAVLGLGLVGLLAAQLASASGCQVVGLDPDPDRRRLASQLGCSQTAPDAGSMNAQVAASTGGLGCDAVLVAAATSSNEPIELAGEIARDRGRVIVIGAVGTNVPRKPFYSRELSLTISRSYGPGRYDPEYEERGHDYPAGFVRWTERRNLEAFAALLASGEIDVRPLVTHRFHIAEAADAYELISSRSEPKPLGVLIDYPEVEHFEQRIDLPASQLPPTAPSASSETHRRHRPERLALGLIGAGAFAQNTVLPILRSNQDIDLIGVCSSTGRDARHAADRFGFRYCTSKTEDLLMDPEIDAVAILTRHDLHATLACDAIAAGKHVFVEKPPALDRGQLAELLRAHRRAQGDGHELSLMVGYNRRYAPAAIAMRDFFADCSEPLMVHYRVNARPIELSHWVHDAEVGGGRVVGEVCHFVDFLQFMTNSIASTVWALGAPDVGRYRSDNLTAVVGLTNGSVGSVTYVANGDPSFAKERVEVFGGGRIAVLDDFRHLTLSRAGRRRRRRARGDKGHRGIWQAFVRSVTQGERTPPLRDYVATSLTTFAIDQALRGKGPASIDLDSVLSADSVAS